MKILAIIISLALALSTEPEAAKTEGTKTEETKSSNLAETNEDTRLAQLSLTDGSALFATIQTPSLPLETLFGTINIPIAVITGAEFTHAAPWLCKDLSDCSEPALAINFDENLPKISTRHQFIPDRNGEVKALRVFDTDIRVTEIPFEFFDNHEGSIEFWARIPEATECGLAARNGSYPALIELSGAFLPEPSPFGVRMLFTNNDGMGRSGLCGVSIEVGHFWIAYGSSSFGRQSVAEVFNETDPAGWHHYAITWNKNGLDLPGSADTADLVGRVSKPLRDNASCAVFVDGRLVAAGVTKEETRPANPATPLALILQKRYAPDQRSWIIDYDDIKIWKRAKVDFTQFANETAKNTATTTPKTRARLTLSDGSIPHGAIKADSLYVKTIFGSVEISFEAIEKINFKPASQKQQGKITPPAAIDPRLIYWNTFDSEEATRVAKVMKRAGSWQSGKLVEGKFGKALHTGGKADVYQFSIPAHALKPKGCIEFWAKIEPETDSFADGAWLRFFWMGHARLEYAVNNGKGAGGITSYIANSVAGSSNYGRHRRYSEVLGPDFRGWHHYALVWNEDGVDVGEGKAKPWSAIFIDGKPVSRETNRMEAGDKFTFAAGVSKESFMTIAGSAFAPEGWQERAVPFAIDELKIWNYDKTDF